MVREKIVIRVAGIDLHDDGAPRAYQRGDSGVRYIARSVSGPAGVADRQGLVFLSRAEVGHLLGTLPAASFDADTFAALQKVYKALTAGKESDAPDD